AGHGLQIATYYSLGGGFVVSEEEAQAGHAGGNEPAGPVPHEFGSAAELLAIGRRPGPATAGDGRRNRAARRPPAQTRAGAGRPPPRRTPGWTASGPSWSGASSAAAGARASCRAGFRSDAGPASYSATSRRAPRRPTRWPRSTG